ncbi:MAG: hypothetical protein A2297_10005 [Elusimicrobia bacterium RIFOXYB2_FULL_48_7]|nr:MAG: hypothetical protein A2297_10005 [Elusimicrobia bacterium RIFOXYB2_FULL_48_7]
MFEIKVKSPAKIGFLCSFIYYIFFTSFCLAQEAGQAGYGKYYEILVESLSSAEPTLKVEALKILPEFSYKSLTPEFKKLLKDKSDLVKIEAARSLFRMKDKSGLPVLIELLKGRVKVSPKDPPVKRAKALAKNMICAKAADVIGEIGDSSVIPLLKEAVKEKGGQVKDAAIVALIKLGDKTEEKVIIYGLDSYEMDIRRKACEILGEVKSEKAREKIRALLKHWDKGVRQSAVVALGKYADKNYGDEIRALLLDKEDGVRRGAAEALGYLGDVKYIPQLKEALGDDNGFVRLYAAQALYKMGDSSAEGFLISVLRTEDSDARLKTVQLFADYGTPESVPYLEDTFNNEKNELIRLNIAGAIARIVNRRAK